MALFSGQPDAVDPGQALGGSHGAHRGVDLALEYRSRRKGFDRQRHDGMTGICGSARLLDEIDDLTPESGLIRSEEHTSELQSQSNIVCRLLLEKNKCALVLHPATAR